MTADPIVCVPWHWPKVPGATSDTCSKCFRTIAVARSTRRRLVRDPRPLICWDCYASSVDAGETIEVEFAGDVQEVLDELMAARGMHN